MNVNKVFLMGRLTADPEQRVSQSGVTVTNFTIAVGRRIKRDETDFIDCVAFSKAAEFLCKYFKKGSLIIVFGSMQVDNWKDKEGKNRKSTRVVVDEVQFGETRRNSESSTAPREQIADRKEEPVAFSNAGSSDIFDDVKDIETDEELPF